GGVSLFQGSNSSSRLSAVRKCPAMPPPRTPPAQTDGQSTEVAVFRVFDLLFPCLSGVLNRAPYHRPSISSVPRSSQAARRPRCNKGRAELYRFDHLASVS